MNEIFLSAVPILEKIEKAGFQAYFVGGSVRDEIAGREINDVDIATSATPNEIKSIFPVTADIGIEHGTLLVIHNHAQYEVTTFRTESGYTDFRRPDKVDFVRSLLEDLKRRDFTMNAIAMDKMGVLHDPFEGRKAIEDKIIVTVGDPKERFHEDALRMLRAIRFAGTLGFKLEEHTFQSLKKHAPLLRNIATERIFSEFEKVLKGSFSKNAIELLVKSEMFQYLPGLEPFKAGLKKYCQFELPCLPSLAEKWSLLLFTSGITAAEPFLRNWKMPVKQIREIQKILSLINQEDEISTFQLFQAGLDISIKAGRVRAVMKSQDVHISETMTIKKFSSLPVKKPSDLAITGNDLLEWRNQRPGPWMKEYLDSIILAVLEKQTENNREAIKEWLSSCNLI
ncbi:CCA tRNA nucleotidyltransferase [Actinomycetes bacterium NPDC127524]